MHHLAGDRVGLFLALGDFADVLVHRRPALEQPGERGAARDQGLGVRLELFEKAPLFGQQRLEPVKHAKSFLDRTEPGQQRAAGLQTGRRGRVEAAHQFAQIRFINRIHRLVQRKPAPFALVLFGPHVEFVGDGEGKHLDIDKQCRPCAQRLAIAIAADRRRANRAFHPGLFQRFLCGGGVQAQPLGQVALGQDPAARAA